MSDNDAAKLDVQKGSAAGSTPIRFAVGMLAGMVIGVVAYVVLTESLVVAVDRYRDQLAIEEPLMARNPVDTARLHESVRFNYEKLSIGALSPFAVAGGILAAVRQKTRWHAALRYSPMIAILGLVLLSGFVQYQRKCESLDLEKVTAAEIRNPVQSQY